MEELLQEITNEPQPWCCGFKLYTKDPNTPRLEVIANNQEGPQPGLEYCPIRRLPFNCLCDHTMCDPEAEYDFYIILQVSFFILYTIKPLD